MEISRRRFGKIIATSAAAMELLRSRNASASEQKPSSSVVPQRDQPRDLAPQGVDFERLTDFMNSLQGVSWQNRTLYLYQKEPDVSKAVLEPAYVKKYKEPIDEEEVRRAAPDGRRFMIIVKTDRLGGQRSEPPLKFFF